MVLSLAISVDFTHQEEKANDEIKKKEMYEELSRKSKQIIKSSLNIIKYREVNLKEMGQTLKQEEHRELNLILKEKINNFRDYRPLVLKKEQEIPKVFFIS